jgi:hypothetical protein
MQHNKLHPSTLKYYQQNRHDTLKKLCSLDRDLLHSLHSCNVLTLERSLLWEPDSVQFQSFHLTVTLSFCVHMDRNVMLVTCATNFRELYVYRATSSNGALPLPVQEALASCLRAKTIYPDRRLFAVLLNPCKKIPGQYWSCALWYIPQFDTKESQRC